MYREMSDEEIRAIKYEECPLKCTSCSALCNEMPVGQCRRNLSQAIDKTTRNKEGEYMVYYKRDGEVVARLKKTSYGYNFERGSLQNGEFVSTMILHLGSERELSYAERALGKVKKVIYEETPCPRTGKVWQ